MIIRERAHARVGILGNPSDGFFGKTIAAVMGNFSANVTLWESPTLRIVPHPAYDPAEFTSLDLLRETAIQNGYYGGMRLLFATCKRFSQYCCEHGVHLPDRAFTIAYDTDIPRQVGLAGSSAIVTAALKALMRFYEVGEDALPKPIQPNLVLDVEMQELAIAAGLQDRVVQIYGGCMFMDFSRDLMEQRGYGEYESLDVSLLPPMYLAWDNHPSDSGRIHNDVRTRFRDGDPDVTAAMRQFARFADEGRSALMSGDWSTLGSLINANFDLRRRIYGDGVIGERNLAMVQKARALGFPAKFPGSGGAIIGLATDRDRVDDLRAACETAGFQFTLIQWLAGAETS